MDNPTEIVFIILTTSLSNRDPTLLGLSVGSVTPTLFGSLFGVIFGCLINNGVAWLIRRHQNFREEYHIKAELENIKKTLEFEIEHKTHKIKPIYGNNHVLSNKLFGANITQVIGWYQEIEEYNQKMEQGSSEERQRNLHSMSNRMGGFLSSGFLKRVPSQPSDLNFIAFIRYLLGKDAKSQ